MKKLILIPVVILFSFCTCKKIHSSKTNEFQFVPRIESVCPEDGKCTVEVLRQKSLEIKTDEFGSIYYKLTDNIETAVIHYQYKRNQIKGLQDGSYREEVFFEINNAETSLSLSNLELQKTKIIYGRLCFCKGQTGYYKISEGTLTLEQKNNLIQFELDFKNNKVPQIIQNIKATVK